MSLFWKFITDVFYETSCPFDFVDGFVLKSFISHLAKRDSIYLLNMPFNLELVPIGFFLTTETKQNYIVGRVRFILVWEVRPVKHWNYVEPRVVF